MKKTIGIGRISNNGWEIVFIIYQKIEYKVSFITYVFFITIITEN